MLELGMEETPIKTLPFLGRKSYDDVQQLISFIKRVCIESGISYPSNLNNLAFLFRDDATVNPHSDANGFKHAPIRKFEAFVVMLYILANITDPTKCGNRNTKCFSFGLHAEGFWPPSMGSGMQHLNIEQAPYSITILAGWMFHILFHAGQYIYNFYFFTKKI